MSLRSYVHESYKELTDKVTWPGWKDLQTSAIVVLIASIIIAMIVFVMDYLFGMNGDTSFWKGILGWIYNFIANKG